MRLVLRPWLLSSDINEVVKTVLNFLLFFYIKILHAPKSTKKFKKHKNITKRKHKYANKRTKMKNTLKNYLRGKSHLSAYLRICACEKKNRRVFTMEMLVSLN